jgi:hypothetical protein
MGSGIPMQGRNNLVYVKSTDEQIPKLLVALSMRISTGISNNGNFG